MKAQKSECNGTKSKEMGKHIIIKKVIYMRKIWMMVPMVDRIKANL